MGCIYITGFISYSSGVNKSLVLLKYNSSGHLVWNNTLGSSYSQGNDIYVTENGDIYVTGFKRNGNNDDISLMKYNSSGDLVMERLWGGPEDEYGYSITLDDTGNMLITGNKKITLNDYDLCILKYNPHGSLEWEKQWGVMNMKIDNFSNIYITGSTRSFRKNTNNADILMVKFDKNGNFLGFKTWDSRSSNDYGLALVIDDLGYAYLTGRISSPAIGNVVDIFLLKYDLNKFPIVSTVIQTLNIVSFCIGIGTFSVIYIIMNRRIIKIPIEKKNK